MDLIHYVEWFGIIAACFVVLQLIRKPLGKSDSPGIYLLHAVVKLMIALTAAYCSISTTSKLIWSAGYLPGAIYIVFLCDAAADLAAAIVRIFRKKPLAVRMVVIMSLILTAAFTVYGTVNMQLITPKEHTYTSDKLNNSYRFVFLADLHYGSSQSPGTVSKALGEIADMKPDFVLLGGDITDEFTTADEMRDIYEQLGSLGVPVYYFYGNHDRQDNADCAGGMKYTAAELQEAIEKNGITILRDDVEVWADDLVILGREDESAGDARCDVSELPERPEGSYVICVDHSPYQEEDIQLTGADLQLSGHVHAGQFFPLRYMYRLSKNNIYGEYRRGDTDLYVSSGFSGWVFPFRTEVRCNYELISLEPAAK